MAIPSKVQEKKTSIYRKDYRRYPERETVFWDPGVVFNPPRNLIADLKGEDTRYHGINNMLLSYVASREGFTDNRWATFAQVKSLQKEGVPFEDQPKIQKGAKGYTIEYWQYSKIKMTVDENGKKVPVMKENPETGRLEPEKIPLNPPLVKTYTVFNASQMDNIPRRQRNLRLMNRSGMNPWKRCWPIVKPRFTMTNHRVTFIALETIPST